MERILEGKHKIKQHKVKKRIFKQKVETLHRIFQIFLTNWRQTIESYETDNPVSFDKLCVNENSNYKDIFYKAFNISPVLMAISTIESRVFVDVNQAWLDTLGYKKKDVKSYSSCHVDMIKVEFSDIYFDM